MLYSITLGVPNSDNNKWRVQTDSYGSSYISNESLRQRIKFGKNVKNELAMKEEGDYSVYELPMNIFFSNNNRNMNLNIVNFWSKDKKVVENHKDDSILYVTVPTDNFRMLEYSIDSKSEIVQTYHNSNIYVGCAVTVTEDSDSIITIKGINTENKQFSITTIGVVDGKVVTNVSTTVSRDDIKKLSRLAQKYTEYSLGFKMFVHPGKLLTKTYIVGESEYAKVLELTRGIKDCAIIALSENKVDEFADEDKEAFKEALIDRGIRAITLCNVTLPKTFCKEFKILYMFNLDLEKKSIKCVRSN